MTTPSEKNFNPNNPIEVFNEMIVNKEKRSAVTYKTNDRSVSIDSQTPPVPISFSAENCGSKLNDQIQLEERESVKEESQSEVKPNETTDKEKLNGLIKKRKEFELITKTGQSLANKYKASSGASFRKVAEIKKSIEKKMGKNLLKIDTIRDEVLKVIDEEGCIPSNITKSLISKTKESVKSLKNVSNEEVKLFLELAISCLKTDKNLRELGYVEVNNEERIAKAKKELKEVTEEINNILRNGGTEAFEKVKTSFNSKEDSRLTNDSVKKGTKEGEKALQNLVKVLSKNAETAFGGAKAESKFSSFYFNNEKLENGPEEIKKEWMETCPNIEKIDDKVAGLRAKKDVLNIRLTLDEAQNSLTPSISKNEKLDDIEDDIKLQLEKREAMVNGAKDPFVKHFLSEESKISTEGSDTRKTLSKSQELLAKNIGDTLVKIKENENELNSLLEKIKKGELAEGESGAKVDLRNKAKTLIDGTNELANELEQLRKEFYIAENKEIAKNKNENFEKEIENLKKSMTMTNDELHGAIDPKTPESPETHGRSETPKDYFNEDYADSLRELSPSSLSLEASYLAKGYLGVVSNMIQLGKKQNSENSEENRSKLEELTGKKELLKDSISFVSKEVINRINNKNFKNDQEKALLINIKYILKSATRRDQFLKSSNPSSSSSSSQSPVSSSSSSSSSSFAAKENKKGSIDSESKSDINSISTEVGGGEEEKNSSI